MGLKYGHRHILGCFQKSQTNAWSQTFTPREDMKSADVQTACVILIASQIEGWAMSYPDLVEGPLEKERSTLFTHHTVHHKWIQNESQD